MEILNKVTEFFDHPFFILVGGITTFIMILSFLYTIYIILRGVAPVWYRLGLGLRKRRIAIFADGEFQSIDAMIRSSNIFNEVFQVPKNSLRAAADESIYLVHWKDYSDVIDVILAMKKDSTPLIVYAPPNEGRIDEVNMEKINAHRNSVVVNFRGRLMNDILTSIITTSYVK